MVCRPDRDDRRLAAGERRCDRRAPERLGAGEAGQPRTALDQPEVDQLTGRLAVLDELAPGGDRHDDLVGQAPAELLRGLEGQRLAALAVVGAKVEVAEPPVDAVGELGAETVDVVVAAVDRDDRRPEDRRPDHLRGLEVAGHHHDGAQSGVRRVRRDGVGEVARAGAGDGGEPVLARPGRRDAHDAILERPRRVLRVVLQVEVAQPELGAEVARVDQRRESLAERDRLGRPRGRQEADRDTARCSAARRRCSHGRCAEPPPRSRSAPRAGRSTARRCWSPRPGSRDRRRDRPDS